MGFLGYVLLSRCTAMQMAYLIPSRLISNEASGSYVNIVEQSWQHHIQNDVCKTFKSNTQALFGCLCIIRMNGLPTAENVESYFALLVNKVSELPMLFVIKKPL